MRSSSWRAFACCVALASLAGCSQPPAQAQSVDAVGLPGPDTDPRNTPPSTMLQASPSSGRAPLPVVFSLSARDPDGDAMTWRLDLGDGGRLRSGDRLPIAVEHLYGAGEHRVAFTVTDGKETSVATVTIRVDEGPAVTPEQRERQRRDRDADRDADRGPDGDDPSEEDPSDDGEHGDGDDGTSTTTSTTSSASSTSKAGKKPTTSKTTSTTSTGTATTTSTTSTTSTGTSSTTTSTTATETTSASGTSTGSTTATTTSASTSTTSSESGSSTTQTGSGTDTTTETSSSSATQTKAPTNSRPVADLSASHANGTAPLTVDYTLAAHDPDGDDITWTLDIRDDGAVEATGTGGDVPRTVQHTFDQPGTYVAVLTVTDGAAVDTDSVTVVVE